MIIVIVTTLTIIVTTMTTVIIKLQLTPTNKNKIEILEMDELYSKYYDSKKRTERGVKI
jgi:hypothetical protein